MSPTASSSISSRSSGAGHFAPRTCSLRFSPVPTPRKKRPGMRQATVAVACATIAGWIRISGHVTPVPILNDSVVCAIAPRTDHTNGLWPWASTHGWMWSEISPKRSPAYSAAGAWPTGAAGEFEDRTHKRYADTGLILEAVLEHGFGSSEGRAGIRRMNQMHGSYDISNDDMRYVLSTFVVVPMRWLDRFGWRPLSEAERRASANYYNELGRHMKNKESPATYEEFAAYLDAYERDHFAYSPGGRAVSDAT